MVDAWMDLSPGGAGASVARRRWHHGSPFTNEFFNTNQFFNSRGEPSSEERRRSGFARVAIRKNVVTQSLVRSAGGGRTKCREDMGQTQR